MNGLIKRLCLGTAQFGLDYGIANKKGKVSKEEVFKILEYAYDTGIDILETAYSYGESEALIGEFISNSKKSFKVISKTPHFAKGDALDVEAYYSETLKRLRQESIHGYLVHNFDDIVSYKEDLWNRIESIKAKRRVSKIGVSLYRIEELEYLFYNNVFFDIIQVPYNILDQRFKDYFSILKEKNKEILVRSVFLQGLFFIDRDQIDRNFKSAEDTIERLRQISKEKNIPEHALCLSFVLLNPLIDKVVIGVDSLAQLKEDIASLEYIDRVRDIYNVLESLKFHNEEVILPFNWKR